MDRLRFMKQLALKAGRLMLQHLRGGLTVQLKDDKTIVTTMDLAVSKLAQAEIHKHFPTYSIMGEEGSVKGTAPFVFSIDEVDGTVPAMLGLGHFVFSIALLMRQPNGQYVVLDAVVYNPSDEVMYWAKRGNGAWARKKTYRPQTIKVNRRALGPGTILDVEWWPQAPRQFSYFPTAIQQMSRRTGTYCLTPGSVINGAMLVASGGVAATVFAGGTDDKVPDVTASSLIVAEAGGIVTDLMGQPLDFTDFCAGALFANPLVHRDVLRYFALNK